MQCVAILMLGTSTPGQLPILCYVLRDQVRLPMISARAVGPTSQPESLLPVSASTLDFLPVGPSSTLLPQHLTCLRPSLSIRNNLSSVSTTHIMDAHQLKLMLQPDYVEAELAEVSWRSPRHHSSLLKALDSEEWCTCR